MPTTPPTYFHFHLTLHEAQLLRYMCANLPHTSRISLIISEVPQGYRLSFDEEKPNGDLIDHYTFFKPKGT